MTDTTRLYDIFENLVRFRTITGNSSETEDCLGYTEQILKAAGMHVSHYASNGFGSIVATTQNTKTPQVFLQAHLDVVPGSDTLFALHRNGSQLRGRGAFDMKYAAACYLMLVEELGKDCSNYDFGIMFTTDEELAGHDGVEHVLRQGYGCKVCILPDGGDNWRLETAAKGDWIVDVTAHGRSAHGSRPWDGDNAITKLFAFLEEASNLAPAKHHTDTTLVVSTINAGNATNQVPAEATASLDIRYLNHEAFSDIQGRLMKLAEHYGVDVSTRTIIRPIELDVSLDPVQEWIRTVSEVRGEEAANGYALSFGASDARFFAEKGIPTIVTRPDGGGMHGDSEWIDEAGLYQFYECIQKYTMSMTSIDLDGTVTTEYTRPKLPETVAAETSGEKSPHRPA